MLTNLSAQWRNRKPLQRWVTNFAKCGALVLLAQSLGCANVPPGDSSPSGRRLRVTMTFRDPILTSSSNLYYFCINKASDSGDGSATGAQNAPGPIPVAGPVSGQSYGNGFATGSNQAKNGFTDFVLFSFNPTTGYGGVPRDGFAIYHVFPFNKGGSSDDRTNFRYTGVPIARIPPTAANPSTIQFDIDLTQIIQSIDGSPVDPIQAVNQANMIQYLQVNVISTNIAPRDSQSAVNKMFDSFGDNRNSTGYFRTLALQDTLWTSADATSTSTNEPTDPDVFPPGSLNDPSLDLVSWRIELRNNN